MKSSVIIKGNKYGFQIVLNPTLPFESLLHEVADKFKESTHFFDLNQPIAVSFEGRDLTQGEQNLLVDTIMENSGLKISYIIDGAKAYETQFANVLSEVRQQGESEEKEEKLENSMENRLGKKGQFYRGTLRSGQKIEVDGSIVVLGDINPGAMVVAGGNVVVLGCLKGTVIAGYPDDKNAFVAALMMEPMQIQIGSFIARSPDQKIKIKKSVRKSISSKKHQPELEAKLAFVENDNIFIETITRSLISEINIC